MIEPNAKTNPICQLEQHSSLVTTNVEDGGIFKVERYIGKPLAGIALSAKRSVTKLDCVIGAVPGLCVVGARNFFCIVEQIQNFSRLPVQAIYIIGAKWIAVLHLTRG